MTIFESMAISTEKNIYKNPVFPITHYTKKSKNFNIFFLIGIDSYFYLSES